MNCDRYFELHGVRRRFRVFGCKKFTDELVDDYSVDDDNETLLIETLKHGARKNYLPEKICSMINGKKSITLRPNFPAVDDILLPEGSSVGEKEWFNKYSKLTSTHYQTPVEMQQHIAVQVKSKEEKSVQRNLLTKYGPLFRLKTFYYA